MFGDALRFPLAGDDGVRSIIIGGILSFLSFLIIPIFPVLGYYLRAAEAGATGSEVAPPFDDWDELLVDGLKVLVVGIAYFLIPLAMFVGTTVAVGVSAFAVGQGGGPPTAAMTGVGVVGGILFLLAVVLSLVATYVFPAGLVALARDGDIAAAFDTSRVFGAAFSADYFVAGLLAIILSLVAGILTFVLTAVTFGLFALLGVFVQFYVQVAFFYLFGRGYGKALDISPTPTVE
jgi:hypothetical protein